MLGNNALQYRIKAVRCILITLCFCAGSQQAEEAYPRTPARGSSYLCPDLRPGIKYEVKLVYVSLMCFPSLREVQLRVELVSMTLRWAFHH